MGFVKKAVGGVLLLGALGAGALGASVWSLNRDKEFNENLYRIENAVEYRHATPPPPPQLLVGISQTPVETVVNPIIDSFVEPLKKERIKFRDSRKSTVMTIAYLGKVQETPEYEAFLRDIAEHEKNIGRFGYLLELVERHDDRRFTQAFENRMESGELIEMERQSGQSARVEWDLLKILQQDDPQFALDYSLRRLSETADLQNKGWKYVLTLSKIGGNSAVSYLMSRFDELRIDHSDILMDAVKSQEDGRRVYFFLQDKFQNSQASCYIRSYDIPKFRRFANQYGDGMKAIPCVNHDKLCYYAPFNSPVLGMRLGCDPVECTCTH